MLFRSELLAELAGGIRHHGLHDVAPEVRVLRTVRLDRDAGVGTPDHLIGGRFDLLTFCFAGEDRSGQALVRYSAPMVTESAQFVFGNATLGKTAAGRPIVHCHAVFRGGDGRMLGGHLLTERCRVGTAPMTVLATSLEGFELRVDVDAETRTPLLHPLSATVSEVAHV